MNDITTEHLALLIIPMVAILFGSAIPLFALTLRYLRRRRLFELHHRERMAAIEKGVEIPPLPEALLYESSAPRIRTSAEILLKGLVWLFVGLGGYLAGEALAGHGPALLAFIPMGIGMAYLIFYALEGRKLPAQSLPPPHPNTPMAESAKT